MTSGWIALLDDLASLTKVAASSLDDVAGQAARAGGKAAGIVIDDAAVTPRYVVGLAAERELPIIAKIAVGSLKNKLLLLLPGALGLGFAAPWAITPLLMAGGAFLCLEGYHKVVELVRPGHSTSRADAPAAQTAAELERERVASAIRTDFILSAEIIVITLGIVGTAPLGTRIGVLVAIALLMTVGVYGLVAGIVKLDDAGLHLTRFAGTSAGARLVRGIGRGLLAAAPVLMRVLGVVGTVAMFLVGGGILTHALPFLPHAAGLLAVLLDGIVGVLAGAVVLAVVLLVKRLR